MRKSLLGLAAAPALLALLSGLAMGCVGGDPPAGSASEQPPPLQSSGECLLLVEEYELGHELRTASDVRWIGESEGLVAAALQGVFRVSLGDSAELGVKVVGQGSGPGQFFLPVYLGASNESMAIASPVHVVGWKRWLEPDLHQSPLDAVLDIDLRDDRLLILGGQIEQGQMAPDGAIAWTTSVVGESLSLRPLHYSATGLGARALNSCGLMDVGAVRLLNDGSAIVVPGVEEGVFRYGPDGRLAETWQSADIGFDADCPLTDQEVIVFAKDEPGRWAWVNQRRVVDDVLPLSDGAGLLVRSVREGRASWELKVLREGEIRTCPIPLQASSDYYLHGDVDGDRILLLLFPKLTTEVLEADGAPRPRLAVMRYRP